jgi:hypothetical protein
MPVPPPTDPSCTGPVRAAASAARTCAAVTCMPLMSFSTPSNVSPTTGMHQYRPSSVRASSSAAMSASRTTPTLWVFVIAIGVVRTPASRTHSSPVMSPFPLRRWQPANSGLSRTSSARGRITVTPVRTGPCPRFRGPCPSTIVAWPTRTPVTSVIALWGPGAMRPISTPAPALSAPGPRRHGASKTDQTDLFKCRAGEPTKTVP